MRNQIIRKILPYLFLVAVVCAVYSNSYRAPFIWDDEALIVNNANIRDLRAIPQAFVSDLFTGTTGGSNFYRPMQTLSFMWDYHWNRYQAHGYHVTNVVLFSIVGVLVYMFLLLLSGNRMLAFWAALLYVAHPINVESVTYISGRAELLLGVGIFGAMIAFIKGIVSTGVRSWSAWYVSLACFAFALLSKEIAVVFPLVLLAYVWCCRRELLRSRRFIVQWIVPFFAILIVYLFLRIHLFSVLGMKHPSLASVPLLARCAVIPKAVFTYLEILVFPVDLHMSRQLLRPTNVLEITLWWSFLSSVCVGWALLVRRSRAPRMWCFLGLWAAIFYAPQSGVFPINAFIAEHFIFLASVSFFAMISALFSKPWARKVSTLFFVSCTLYLSSLTVARNYEWQDPGVFYSKILKNSPSSFQAHNNLGLYFQRKGQNHNALFHYRMAVFLEPKLLEARSNLGYLYTEMGNYQEAKKQYLAAVLIAPVPKVAEIHNNLGTVYEREGALEDALQRYTLALKIDPSLKYTHYNLARIYYATNRLAMAADEVYTMLASTLRPGEEQKARTLVDAIVRQQGCLGTAAVFFNDAGVRFAQEDLLDTALAFFTMAADLQPKNVDARFNKGLIYLKRGQMKDAASEMRAVLALDPSNQNANAILVDCSTR